jgi:predicted Zn-dependent protease|tara:strand:+ start:382 stop:2109 length:1728 start_codon:yes stop_codon:yes gene_type:complete
MIPTIRQRLAAILFALLLYSPLQSTAVSEETDRSAEQADRSAEQTDNSVPQAGSSDDSDDSGTQQEDELDELERADRQVQKSSKEIEKSLKEVAKNADKADKEDKEDKKKAKKSKREKKKYAKEIEIGKQAHRQIVSQFGIYRNKELRKYVTEIGEKVAKLSSRPDMDFTFTILDDDMVNAMALPGGYIYVTRGLLAHMSTEGELAAVLGHEIAHVTERHAFRKQNRAKAVNILTAIAAMASGQYNTVPQLSDLFSGPLMQGFSREFELEADRVGAEYMAKAGYSPESMLRTIEVLKSNEKLEYEQARNENRDARVYHGFLASHPDNDKRYEQTIREAAKLNREYSDFVDDDEFLDKLNGLTWGKARQVGVVRKNMFYYPKLGIKLTFPMGWHVASGRSGVVIMSSNWDAAMEISSRPVKPGMTPRQFLEEHVGLRLRKGEGATTTVADMPAFVGIAERAPTQFGLKPIRVAALLDGRNQQAYILSGSGKKDLRSITNDKEFIGSIFSLAKMTRADYKKAKKPKVQVVRVEPGTTYKSLAADSPIPNYAEQKLRVINGHYPNGEPEAGQLVKVIQ